MTIQERPRDGFRRRFVQDATGLIATIPELESMPVIAVDIEMGQRMERRPGGVQEWIHSLALIQVAGGDLSVVIDPLRCSPAPLKNVMAGSARKVFLGGGQDAALLERAGIPALNIADVGEVALALFGRREDGMAALARRIFGVSLDKTVRRTDWLLRPLNPTLLAYAHRDAELTLMIFEWFQREYPEVLALHERRHLDESMSATAPLWLQQAVPRQASDVLAVLMEHGLDPQRDQGRLAQDVRGPLLVARAPRLVNRLLRIAGELQLHDLLPMVLPMVDSPSSLIRASSARAIGLMASRETGEPLLKEMLKDPIEDVKKAAEAGLRDLKSPPSTPGLVVPEEEIPSLSGDAMNALQRLKAQLEGAE